MKRMLLGWAVVAVLGYIGYGCTNDPLPTTPSADYPCGVAYVACVGPDGALDGMCCDENTTCGGGPNSVGCPDGMCCFVGEPNARKRLPTKQWRSK